jgi:hypothetical protein
MKSAHLLSTACAALLCACSGMSTHTTSDPVASEAMVPDAIKVPQGQKVAMETVGAGEITYECRAKAGTAGSYEWVFVGPDATLSDRSGKAVGRYYGPPATWESMDGSKITGTQVAVAPAGAGSIPYQLVKANPAMGQGQMSGVTYVQRVATRGGVAPATPCTADNQGRKEIARYQADYIFWKAA